MKTREQIITGMCYTWRHDYGLLQAERDAIWNQMAQLFDNNIAPYMEFKAQAVSRDICGND